MPALYLALAVFILSQSALMIRLADADPMMIGFWRLAFAIIILYCLCLVKRTKITISQIATNWKPLLSCAVFLFLHWYTWFIAVKSTSAANAMIVFCSNPIFTAFGAWAVFKERISTRHLLALGLSLIGTYVLVAHKFKLGLETLQGDAYSLASSVLFSGYVLTGKKARQNLPNLPFTTLLYTFSCLGFFSIALSRDLSFLNYDSQTWIALVCLAIGPTVLGHALFTYCLNYIPLSIMSLSTLTEPVLAAITAALFLNEPLTLRIAAGFALVAIAMTIVVIAPGEKQ